MDDFDRELERELNNYLKNIQNRCREILQDSIQSEVYDKYKPKVYERTYQLLNNVRTEIKNNVLYVYVNTGNMHYEANSPKGMDITKSVPFYVNYGHNNSNNPEPFMYNSYPSRNFIEETKRRIEEEFNCQVEIMNEYDTTT